MYRLGRAAAVVLRVLGRTLRFEARGREGLPPSYVLVLWHGRAMGSTIYNRDSGCVTMSSQSRDGSLGAGIVEGLGLVATRGSSSRGGREGFVAMERALKAGAPFAALTVDGPRGPWRRVKPGALLLARRAGLPVVPITFSCDRFVLLRGWDRGLIPMPFARVVVAYGEPIHVRSPGSSAETAERVGAALDELTMQLDRRVLGRELWPPRASLPPLEEGVGGGE